MQIFGNLSVRRNGVFEQPACRFPWHITEYQEHTLTAESQVTHFSGNLAFTIFTNSLVINVFTLQPEVRLFGLEETLTLNFFHG